MSLAKWARIEPHAQTTDLNVGLVAEVADPLWLLARQLQLGELVGDDGGTPVAVHVQSSWSRFTRYQADGAHAPGAPVVVDASSGPIEAIVERQALLATGGEPPDTSPDDWAARLRAGRTLDRTLRAHDFARVAARMATDPATTFAPPVAGEVRGVADDRYRTLLDGRVIDGARVLALHRSDEWLPDALLQDLDRAQLDDLRALLDTWSVAVERAFGVAPVGATEPGSWIPDRLEYAFRLGAPPLPGTDREVVLRASEYDGTGVEWYSLDLDVTEGASLGANDDGGAGDVVGTRRVHLLPAPLTYPGMPANRFWEMEDAAVALGNMSAGPTDLARIVAIDFALVYGPDWFLAPIEVPVGCVAQIDWVVVRDTFGVATLVGTTATQAGDGVGRQFQPSVFARDGGDEGDIPMLVVLPSSLGSLRSELREDVALQRDEVANLAWAIERVVMGPTGRGVDRPWFQSEFESPPVASEPGSYEVVWRLSTPVARSWIPFVARVETDGTRLLRKGRLLDTPTDGARATVSKLLEHVDTIREEEVTRTGIRVTTADQLARWCDGRTFAWRGREKRPARGEVSSHLRFDSTSP